MALEKNQKTLALNTLYEVENLGADFSGIISSNVWVNSGTIALYGSNSATAPTSLSEMTLNEDDSVLGGTISLGVAPRYLAMVQVSGTSTEIISTGLQVTGLGAIS